MDEQPNMIQTQEISGKSTKVLSKQGWYEKFNKYGFLILVVFILGMAAGIFSSSLFFERSLDRSVKLGGIIIGDKPYSLQERAMKLQ